MSYLIKKYKGIYRLKCPYDLRTNQFPRKLNGLLEDTDVYIDGSHGKIFYYGKGIMQCYIPSLIAGRNIVKQIYSMYINPDNTETITSTLDRKDGKQVVRIGVHIKDDTIFDNDLSKNDKIIFNIEETDSEVLFLFKVKDDEKIIPYIKPKTSGANISPFSSKNLPKNKDYKIPDDELEEYKNVTSNIPSDKLLTIGIMTTNFLKSLVTKKNTWDDIKADIALKGLKGKEYIHSINKWEDYLLFLTKNI